MLKFFFNVDLPQLDRAFTRVRNELAEVGLLEDGKYLDRINCELTSLPRFTRECGWVYDGGVSIWDQLLGYETGTIYVPPSSPAEVYRPGETLTDVLRHEFAHAWAWVDLAFVDARWFRDTFGARYHDDWEEGPDYDPDDFVSEYAATAPKEDFAETFMFFLRYRNSLDRFRPRPGLYRKLRAVERAVKEAARTRTSRIRGPRVESLAS